MVSTRDFGSRFWGRGGAIFIRPLWLPSVSRHAGTTKDCRCGVGQNGRDVKGSLLLGSSEDVSLLGAWVGAGPKPTLTSLPSRCPDDIAGDDQLYSAVLLPACRSIVGCHWLALAESMGRNRRCDNPRLNQEVANRARSMFRQLHIEFIGSNAIGMAFHLELQTWIRQNDA
jgi:hypothetical protein